MLTALGMGCLVSSARLGFGWGTSDGSRLGLECGTEKMRDVERGVEYCSLWYEGNIDIHCGWRHVSGGSLKMDGDNVKINLEVDISGKKNLKQGIMGQRYSSTSFHNLAGWPFWGEKAGPRLDAIPGFHTLQNLKHHKQSNIKHKLDTATTQINHVVPRIKYQPSPSKQHFCFIFVALSFPPRGGGGGQANCSPWGSLLLHHRCAELQQLTATSDARLWRAAVR